MPLDMGAGDVDQVRVVDLDRAGGDAGQAGQAAIEVMHGLFVRRPTLFQHGADQVDAAARGIVLVAAQHIGWASGGAEAIMHAGAQNTVGLCNLGLCQLLRCKRGLQNAARSRMDWTRQSQHNRAEKSWFSVQGALAARAVGRRVMTNRHWSTRDVSIGDQFAYWREAVCEAVMNVATENPAENDFFGDIGCAVYGELRFAAFTSSPHQIVRRASHVARSNHEHYLVSLQRSGVSRMQQCGRTCELQAGDIGIVDGARPFSVTFPRSVGRIVAVIPSAMLHSRAPWLRERPIGLMMRDGALHDVLRTYLERLAGPDCGSPAEAELLADNLCNLVALLTARDAAEQRASQERVTDLDRMFAFLRRRLSDPDLSPQALADHIQVSVRTVHKRFEQANITFRQWLLEQRLDACRRALADPRCATMTVSQIAYGLGFNDLSHFTKAFRARFGMPPGRFRIDHSSARSRESASPESGFPHSRQ